MDLQDKGFLNDTSLSKTPKSPLKTSTVLKPNLRRGSAFHKQKTNNEVEMSYNLSEGTSFPALSDASNIPNFAALKMKFNESSFADDRNSSLGILKMDNFSDFTDTSLRNIAVNTKLKVKSKRMSKSKLCKSNENKTVKKKSFPSNVTVQSTEDLDEHRERESPSSSDIEYDGTNIPELNLDYDPISSHKVTVSDMSQSKFSESAGAKLETEQLFATTGYENNSSNTFDFTNKSIQSSKETESLLADDSTKPRDSIFETFDPAYDSIFQTIMPSDGKLEMNNTKFSELMKGPPFSNFNSTEIESIFQNQSLAELNFMKNIETLNPSNQNSSMKFCTDEISARSSSFSSLGESRNISKTFASGHSSKILNAEDFKEKVLGVSSFVESSCEKSESYKFTPSLKDKNSITDFSECISEVDTFLKSKTDVSLNAGADIVVENSVKGFEYSCDLNFKDMSVFVTKSDDEQDQMKISDSDFISSGDAIELFKKDEEILNQEKMFEIGNDSNKSSFNISSAPSQNEISAPSWYLELSSDQLQDRISIGTLISARTECLGRLSQDSQRERPFFGTVVHTPIREFQGSSSTFSESVNSTLQSTSEESTPVANRQFAFSTAVYETPKSHFENTEVFGNDAGALRSVLQSYSPSNENELIRSSALSQLLGELSTDQPLKLASQILEKGRPLHQKLTNDRPIPNTTSSAAVAKKRTETFLNTSIQSDKLNSTLTRSSSEGSLGNIISNTPKNLESNTLSISNVELNNANRPKDENLNGCPSCQQQKVPYMYFRPPSSCSSSCSNPMPIQNALQAQYAGMKYLATSQELYHQNLCSSLGSIPRSDNGSRGCQNHNQCFQDMLRFQMGVGPQQTPIPSGCSQYPMQGSLYPSSVLQGPSEQVFPEKLSVGDSQCISLTVQNLHNLHFYHVSFVSGFLNEEPVSLDVAGISFPVMVPRSSNNTTDIQITLSPKYEGKIIITLQVIASYNSANMALSASPSLSLQTKIKYESIRPCISISSKGQSKLDLDKVIAGSTVVEYITINNRCDAAVPLHISLSDDFQDNRITFGLNHMKKQKHPAVSGWKMLSPKLMRYRLPCSRNVSMGSQVDIPIIFEAGKQDADPNFTLTVAIESYSISETLGWFRISASVGNAKLVLTDFKQNHLLLNARRGSTCSKSLNVKNESSFPVIYDLAILDDTQSFSVSPTSLNLKPMQSCVISISFSPTSSEDVNCILQAAAQPHGKIFRVTELVGNVKSVLQNQGSSRSSAGHIVVPEQRQREAHGSSRSSNIIQCNKKYLCWGGIEMGNSMIKTFGIKNYLNKSIKAKLFIKEKSIDNFKILGEGNQPFSNLTMSLNAKEQRTISIVFAPTKTEPSSGFLVVKPLVEKDSKIFSMPLSGYGGIGKLKVTQVTEKEGIGSCLDIVLPTERKTVNSSFTVHNAGVRACFVKALFTAAVSLANPSEFEVSINPSEFVLCERENKTLYISYNCEEPGRNLLSGDCGVITLLYGDEVLRQQLRRSNNEACRSIQNDMIHNVNFDARYIGEEKVSYDPLYQCIPRISSMFSMNIKRYLIHLNIVEQNASYSQMTFDAMITMQDMFSDFTFNSTVFSSRRLTTATNMDHSPPVQDFTVNMLNRLSMPTQHNTYSDVQPHCELPKVDEPPILLEASADSWITKPETLVMDSSNKDNRVSLVNLVQHDLKFKIESAIDVISVSPVFGIIPAKGEIGLRITIIPFNYSKLSEDYKGYIKITCDGKERSVLVNVLKDQKKVIGIPESNLNIEYYQQSISEESLLDKIDNTIVGLPSIFIKNICDFPKEITLDTTVPGKVSETLFTFRNIENVSVRWDIRPSSMLFTESFDDSSISTQILQIRPSSGTLESMEVSNIVIKFTPSIDGNYSQFFELTIVSENGTREKCFFKLYAKASTSLTESTNIKKPRSNAEHTKRSKDTIYAENELIQFPNTPVGQSSKMYATVKNGSSHNVELNIIKPQMPFVVLQSSMVIKPKTFLKIPVNFVPKEIRDYEDTLIFHSEGSHFMINLKGTSIGNKK